MLAVFPAGTPDDKRLINICDADLPTRWINISFREFYDFAFWCDEDNQDADLPARRIIYKFPGILLHHFQCHGENQEAGLPARWTI